MKEKKLRIEDALAATKAAVEEGIVAGGGIACMNAIPAVAEFVDTLEGDAKTGAKIVLKALEEPLRQIVANAGLEGSVSAIMLRRLTRLAMASTLLQRNTQIWFRQVSLTQQRLLVQLSRTQALLQQWFLQQNHLLQTSKSLQLRQLPQHLIWAECTNPVSL